MDDFATCVAGRAVRVDLYGEIFDQRCTSFLTREQALRLSRELAKHALSLPARLPIVIVDNRKLRK